MYESNNIVTLPINTKKKVYKKNSGDGGDDDMNGRIVKLEGKVELLDCKIDSLNKDMDRRFSEVDRRFSEVDRRFTETNENIKQTAIQTQNSIKVWILGGALIFILTILPSFIINITKIFQALH